MVDSKRFLIYSLPRSGSAWLSTFLSRGDCFCYHELLAETPAKAVGLRLCSRSEPVQGTIETFAFSPGMDPYEPGMETWGLVREQQAIAASIKALTNKEFDLKAAARQFFSIVEKRQANVIYHKYLGDVHYLEELWQRIVGKGFDLGWAEKMIEMNVQRSLQMVTEKAIKAGRI